MLTKLQLSIGCSRNTDKEAPERGEKGFRKTSSEEMIIELNSGGLVQSRK